MNEPISSPEPSSPGLMKNNNGGAAKTVEHILSEENIAIPNEWCSRLSNFNRLPI